MRVVTAPGRTCAVSPSQERLSINKNDSNDYCGRARLLLSSPVFPASAVLIPFNCRIPDVPRPPRIRDRARFRLARFTIPVYDIRASRGRTVTFTILRINPYTARILFASVSMESVRSITAKDPRQSLVPRDKGDTCSITSDIEKIKLRFASS